MSKIKIKEMYKYDNIKLENYNTNEKYNIFIFDAIYKSISNNFSSIQEVEKENLYLIKKSYLLLKNLNNNGTFILFIFSALNSSDCPVLLVTIVLFDFVFLTSLVKLSIENYYFYFLSFYILIRFSALNTET